MARRPEGGPIPQKADAPRAVVAGVPSHRDVSLQVRELARDFDVMTGSLQHERGFDQKRLPFAVRLQDLTQAHVEGIAALFGTTISQDNTVGFRVQNIVVPNTGDKIKFFSAGNEGRESATLDPYLVLLYAQQEGKDTKRFHQLNAADERGRRHHAVVLGPDSVSFVQDPRNRRLSDEDPKNYLIATVSHDGFGITATYDYLLLHDPIHRMHRLNLAKAITVLDPDFI